MHVNDQYYEKVNHITKHLTLAKQHSASFCSFWYTGKAVHSAISFVTIFSGTVCKMRLAAYSVEWEAHPNSMIDSWIRGFVEKWTRGLVDSWIVVFVNSWIVDSWIRGVVIRGFVDRQVCGPVGSWIS